MFYNVNKRCNELGVGHTFHDKNMGSGAFNKMYLRQMLCKSAALLVNEPKLANLRPLIESVTPKDVIVDFKFTSAGIVQQVSFTYQDARVELSYRRK